MRSRNIKPGYFANEVLGQMDPLAQILFAGLWCLADRNGVLEDRPLRIKGQIIPYRDCDIDALLGDLASNGFIVRYEVGGVKLIHITKFAAHQTPHHTERKAALPLPSAPVNPPLVNREPTVNPPLRNGGNPPDSLIPDSLIPDSLSLNHEQNGSERVCDPLFEKFWEEYPTDRRNIGQTEARNLWQTERCGQSTLDSLHGWLKSDEWAKRRCRPNIDSFMVKPKYSVAPKTPANSRLSFDGEVRHERIEE